MNYVEVKEAKKYFNGTKAVDGVSFNVKKGEIFGLLGPNGAGKSTMISIITTLIKDYSGSVCVNNFDVGKKPNKVKPLLGIVPQEIAIYPALTAYENLDFWGKMYGLRGNLLKERIEEALKLTGLEKRSRDRIDKYSGGMKRRVNIACALLHKPELILMDEPTVGIDPQSRNHILETVLSLNRDGMTVVYTSHYMEEVEFLCSRIAIMDMGKIIAIGSKDELNKLMGVAEQVKIEVKDYINGLKDSLTVLDDVEHLDIKEKVITIVLKKSGKGLSDIVNVFEDNKCELVNINMEKPNLESVFLHLTGRALRD